jgi:hypothetical protein
MRVSDRQTGARRRTVLLTVAALGAFVCLIGGTVLFSALTDTARTGTNSVDSAALAASADIQLAEATRAGTAITCGTFTEDLESPLFTVTGVSPGFIPPAPEYFCIKNVGSQSVMLSALADELADTDSACTGDETLHGDTTCGGNQLGELSGVLSAAYRRVDCETAEIVDQQVLILSNNATTPAALGALASSTTACFGAFVAYPADTAAASVQTAQSDRSTWRYRFTAQA